MNKRRKRIKESIESLKAEKKKLTAQFEAISTEVKDGVISHDAPEIKDILSQIDRITYKIEFYDNVRKGKQDAAALEVPRRTPDGFNSRR